MTESELKNMLQSMTFDEILESMRDCTIDPYYYEWYLDLEKELKRRVRGRTMEFTGNEIYLVSKIFQNYYHMGIDSIAEEDEVAKSLFIKLGLIEGETNE